MGIKHSRPVPPFMRYCSAIIPTMFDDSLSYYEALCALNRFIQTNLVEVINNNASVTQEYITLVDELKEYVEHYFDNLDVQEEINNKLDEMASDGSLGVLLQSYVQPYVNQMNNRVDSVEQDITELKYSYGAPLVASTVAGMTNQARIYVYTGSEAGYTAGHWYYYSNGSWTDGGVYQSTSVATDKTLTLENAPADALYTGLQGQALTEPARVLQPLWANKAYNRNTDTYSNSTKNVTTTQKVNFSDFVEIAPPAGFRIGAFLMETTPVVYNFQKSPLTLTPNKDWVVVLQNEDETQDIDVITARNLSIKYGGSLTDTMLIKGETTSYTFDANQCVNDGRYWINTSTKIFTTNFPINNQDCILINRYEYKIGYSSQTRFLFQEVHYPVAHQKEEVYIRLLNTYSHTGFTEWTKVAPDFGSTLNGKSVSFYGDSITTFAGYIPEGNVTYYTGANNGVSSVNQCWWKETIDALGLTLNVNNSWSGRRVSDFSRPDDAYKQENIDAISNGTDPDLIIVKIGINDFNNNATLGSYDGSGAWGNDMTVFSNAYATMLDRIMTTYPLAKVYCCSLNNEIRSSNNHPTRNGNGETLATWNNRIKAIANAFGAEFIDHANCGITEYNLDEYAGDYNPSTGHGLHPNADGMALIANKTIDTLDNEVRKRF